MKVIHFTASKGLFGAEKTIIELAFEQKKVGLDVSVVSLNLGNGSDVFEEELKAKKIDYQSISFKKRVSLSQFLSIKNIINRTRPDLIHCHNYKSNIYLAPFVFDNKKLKKITTVHGYLLPPTFSLLALYYLVDKKALNFFDKVVLVSEKIKNEIPKNLLNKERVSVISNGISIEKNSVFANNNEDSFKVNNKNIHFVCVGRLSAEKNYGEAITLFKEISGNIPNSDLWIIGDGPEESKLKKLVNNLDLNDKVFFTGYLKNAERFIASFDCMLITSLSEGLPITLLEGMKSELLIVYRDVGEIDSVLMHGELGYRIDKPLDVCAKEIANILRDKSLVSRIRAGALKRLIDSYSASSMELSYRKLYESLLK